MTTYTIAYTKPTSDGSSLLLATVPDGDDVYAAVKAEVHLAQLETIDEDGKPLALSWDAESGLLLTDELPEDESRIVWQGHGSGWLMDEEGKTYAYAVRP